MIENVSLFVSLMSLKKSGKRANFVASNLKQYCMKTKEEKVSVIMKWVVCCLIALLPLIGYAKSGSDSETKKPIILNGQGWTSDPSSRSLAEPFIAFLEEDVISIQSTTSPCDLILTITDCNSGREVYVMEVPQEASGQIMVSVDGLRDGRYCLTISNPEKGYVYGEFTL